MEKILNFPVKEDRTERIIQKILGEVFRESDLYMWSLPELAMRARISASTIYNLWHRRNLPRASTLMKLVHSVGMELYVTGSRIKTRKRA